jgi:N-methylhydantoinase A
MLHADVRHDYVRVFFDKLDSAEVEKAGAVFRQLEQQAMATLAREGFAAADTRIVRALDLRYIAQQWDITVPADAGFDRAAIRRDFEREHQRLFGHIQPGGSIEITKPGCRPLARSGASRRSTRSARPAMPSRSSDDGSGSTRSRVDRDAGRDGAALNAGNVIVGPAVINEMTTTLLIGRDDRMSVDASGNYSIEISR